MRDIGEELMNARLERGMSLKTLQQLTKIRSRYLEAIEAGNFSVIPGGDVYVKGFIRSYARAVGLPEQRLITRYENLLAEIEARQMIHREERGPSVWARLGRLLKACVQGTLQWFGL